MRIWTVKNRKPVATVLSMCVYRQPATPGLCHRGLSGRLSPFRAQVGMARIDGSGNDRVSWIEHLVPLGDKSDESKESRAFGEHHGGVAGGLQEIRFKATHASGSDGVDHKLRAEVMSTSMSRRVVWLTRPRRIMIIRVVDVAIVVAARARRPGASRTFWRRPCGARSGVLPRSIRSAAVQVVRRPRCNDSGHETNQEGMLVRRTPQLRRPSSNPSYSPAGRYPHGYKDPRSRARSVCEFFVSLSNRAVPRCRRQTPACLRSNLPDEAAPVDRRSIDRSHTLIGLAQQGVHRATDVSGVALEPSAESLWHGIRKVRD